HSHAGSRSIFPAGRDWSPRHSLFRSSVRSKRVDKSVFCACRAILRPQPEMEIAKLPNWDTSALSLPTFATLGYIARFFLATQQPSWLVIGLSIPTVILYF